MDREMFLNPPMQYRGKPFWAWNGELKESELLRQIHNFKQMGMGGYFCHSRTGLVTRYLGEEWFKLINACADEGSHLRMETWLYDEDRWPSGTAGGMVTENPEYRQCYLRLNVTDGASYRPPDGLIAAFTVSLSGQSFTGKKRLSGGERPQAGDTVLYFTVEEMAAQSDYNGFTYVDAMNPKAVAHFINITHERYAAECGERLGREIKGIFTDEPHRGAVMNGFGVSNPHPENLTPYTPLLFAEFEKRFGYDLRDCLPELFLFKDGVKCSPVKWQYMELLQELFCENYLIPIQEWCRAHGMLSTGHVLHEDTLTNQACMIGSVMRAYEYMDVPGMDLLGENNTAYWIAVQLRSVGRQMDKKLLLTELYGCTGWQMDFAGHKAVGDWQALFGVNMRCHHLCWYSMKGEAKRDYPASIFHQSAWYQHYGVIEDYFARMNLLLSQGDTLCDTLVINPVESVWAVIHPGWSNAGMASIDEDVCRVEQHYADLFQALAAGQIDFDYGDEQHIADYGRVECGADGVRLRLGKMTYRTVIVPYMLTIRSTTLALLKEFAERGGQVMFTGGAPACVDASASGAAGILRVVYTDLNSVAARINPPFIRIETQSDEAGRLFSQIVKRDNDYFAVFLNTDRTRSVTQARILFAEAGHMERWDVRTGGVTALGAGRGFVADFAPAEEYCVRLIPSGENAGTAACLPDDIIDGRRKNSGWMQLSGGAGGHVRYRYELSEPNVGVLDMVMWKTNGGWHERQDILLADRDIRQELGLQTRGGSMLQPWFTGQREQPVAGEVTLAFDFKAEWLPERVCLAIESPKEFRILVNGRSDALKPTDGYWVDECFTVLEIDRSALCIGENRIVLSAGLRSDLNLEAMYLLGDFGVRLEDSFIVLTPMPQTLQAGDITQQGFPFYGAGLTYLLEDLPEGLSEIRFDGFDAALVTVSGNGRQTTVFAPPYEADTTDLIEDGTLRLEYIMTRRNTFGPLHFRPIYAATYGPATFVAENESIRDGYGLIPQGMTQAVQYRCTAAVKHMHSSETQSVRGLVS